MFFSASISLKSAAAFGLVNAAGNGVVALARAVQTGIGLVRAFLGTGSRSFRSSAMALAKGVSAANECHVLAIVHAHATKDVANGIGGSLGIGFAPV